MGWIAYLQWVDCLFAMDWIEPRLTKAACNHEKCQKNKKKHSFKKGVLITQNICSNFIFQSLHNIPKVFDLSQYFFTFISSMITLTKIQNNFISDL